MRASHYAQALYRATNDGKNREVEKTVAFFLDIVKANGHTHLLSRITKSLARLELKADKRTMIEVTSAQELSEQSVLELLKKEPFSKALESTHRHVVRKTDDTIIGGVVVRTASMRIDASHKRTLIDMYKGMTETL